MNEYNDQKFYEHYKEFFEGTENSLDLSDMPLNLPLPKELDGEDVYDVLMLFRDEKTALDWIEENCPDCLVEAKDDLMDRDCGVSAIAYRKNHEHKYITMIKYGAFVLWDSY